MIVEGKVTDEEKVEDSVDVCVCVCVCVCVGVCACVYSTACSHKYCHCVKLQWSYHTVHCKYYRTARWRLCLNTSWRKSGSGDRSNLT